MKKATFQLKDFIASVRSSSLARNNRFEVFIIPPKKLTQREFTCRIGPSISLYCEQASLPPLNIAAKSFKIFGPSYQRPITSEYGGEGMSFTFHVDRDMNVRKFFEDWMHLIVDPNDFTVGYQEDYITSIYIRQLDEQNNVTHEIELLEAFPRSMNLMELNNSADNQTHRLNILFGYRYWKDVARGTPVNVPTAITSPEIPSSDTRVTYNISRPVTPEPDRQIGNPKSGVSN